MSTPWLYSIKPGGYIADNDVFFEVIPSGVHYIPRWVYESFIFYIQSTNNLDTHLHDIHGWAAV